MYLKKKAINYERDGYSGEKGVGGSPLRPPRRGPSSGPLNPNEFAIIQVKEMNYLEF